VPACSAQVGIRPSLEANSRRRVPASMPIVFEGSLLQEMIFDQIARDPGDYADIND
jgi:hypothetical protein